MSDNNKSNKIGKKSGKNSETDKNNAALWIAIIGGIVSIVLGILGFPPLITYLNTKWNATPTQTLVFPASETPSVSPTSLVEEPITATAVQIDTDTPVPTIDFTNGVMNAQVTNNYATGNAPLTVTFNAQSSYVSYQNGTIDNCEFKNVCSYSWDVRQGSTAIYGPQTGGSVFSYTFAKKGEYTVVVYVCRGDICSFAAASIIVK